VSGQPASPVRWSWLAGLAAPLAAVAAGTADPLDALMHGLAARRHGHVAYTEVQYLAMLERPLESSGELIYEAPDRLEKRTLSPRPETLVLEHGTLSATRGRHTRTLELTAWPQLAPLLESLRATLAGDRTALEYFFNVTLDGDAAHWTLHLSPRDPAAARLVSQVSITGAQADLRAVEIVEADGDRSVLTIGRELPP
jgi:hypothetical protein